MVSKIKRPIGGAVYVLPNLLTTGNLFFGFFSIVKSMQGNFAWAGHAIMLAAVFDVLDGRVARLTKGTSEFGVQYDSLCDLVSFGLAPAFLMYQYGLNGLGRIGWIACFIFLACGALRLARFNVRSSIGQGSEDFVGLPIPMAAMVIACFASWNEDLDPEANSLWFFRFLLDTFSQQDVRSLFLMIVGPSLALLMVSNIIYRSHKTVRLKGIRPFRLLVILVLSLGLIAYQPAFCGLVLCLGYALSGIIEWAIGWKKTTSDDDIFAVGNDEFSGLQVLTNDKGSKAHRETSHEP